MNEMNAPTEGDTAAMQIEELVRKLEKATGPSRELDRLIVESLHPGCRWAPYSLGRPKQGLFDATGKRTILFGEEAAPNYTSSLDAALKLVPSDRIWSVGQRLGAPGFVANLSQQNASSAGATPALALTTAALKARAALSKAQGS